MEAVLSVVHRHTAGWHTFTSGQLPGLFLTGPDEQFAELREALASTINALIHADSGINPDISPLPSFIPRRAHEGCEETLHFRVAGLG